MRFIFSTLVALISVNTWADDSGRVSFTHCVHWALNNESGLIPCTATISGASEDRSSPAPKEVVTDLRASPFYILKQLKDFRLFKYSVSMQLTEADKKRMVDHENLGILFPAILGLKSISINSHIHYYDANLSYDSIGPIFPINRKEVENLTLKVELIFSANKINSFTGLWFTDGFIIAPLDQLVEIRSSTVGFQKHLAFFCAWTFLLVSIFSVVLFFSDQASAALGSRIALGGLTAFFWAVFFLFLSGLPRSLFPETRVPDLHYIFGGFAYHSLLRLVVSLEASRLNRALIRFGIVGLLLQLMFFFIGDSVLVYRMLSIQHICITLASLHTLAFARSPKKIWPSFALVVYSALILSDCLKLNRDLFGIHYYPFPYFARYISLFVLFGLVVFTARSYSLVLSASTLAKATLELSERVAHDIRSPLATVNAVIATAKGLKDEDRDLLRRAVSQIKAIADDVLRPKRSSSTSVDVDVIADHSAPNIKQQISWVLEQLEMEYSKRGGAQIELRIRQPDLFAELPRAMLYRVLSNLINNGIESYAPEDSKKVILSLTQNEDMAEIVVLDHGRGIPDSVLSKIGEKGFSFGKEAVHTAGSGLGLYSSGEALRQHGGSLSVSSKEGQGTSITVRLPLASPPSWFVKKIEPRQYKQIICADDNSGCREIYLKYLESPTLVATIIELKELMRANIGSHVLYFVDYDFNESTTGLDLIEMFDLGNSAVLVSGVAGDEVIQARCEKAGCKLVSKDDLVKVLTA